MKKSLAVLGTVGVGAGVLLALKNRKGKTGNGESNETSEQKTTTTSTNDNSAAGGNGQATAARMAKVESEPVIDDLGTDQAEASQILKHIRDAAFDSNDEKLALALGRPTEEIEQWIRGEGMIDGDVVMKARALAIERGVEI